MSSDSHQPRGQASPQSPTSVPSPADTEAGGQGAPSLWTHTAQAVLDAAGARRSVPTGGSVTAIGGAFGVSLLMLAVNLSLTKRDPAPELTALHDRLRATQRRIQQLGDEDAALFAAFVKEVRQGSDPAAEAELRRDTCEVPLALGQALAEGLELARELRPLVHTSVVSDVQAGAALIHGALGAALFTLAHSLSGLAAQDQEKGGDDAQAADIQAQWARLREVSRAQASWLSQELDA